MTNVDDGGARVAAADVAGFAQKLDAWAQGLTPTERALLHRLIDRAAAADPEPDDAEGYIIIVGGLAERGIIVIGGHPSPLFAQALGVQRLGTEGPPIRSL